MTARQQQSISSLKYYLYDRPIHPELFEIYNDRHLITSGYEAQIWVTGCTHVIGFFRDGRSLVELTADDRADLPQRGMIKHVAFRGEKVLQHKRSGGINYMMNFQVEQMSPMVYHKTHHDLAKIGAARGMFVPFPTWMTNPPLTPFTFIDYEAKPSGLHVFAFHAFPDDLTIVKTQSLFELI
ncbi:MAG: DUF2617 family protein [Phycisphaerales bacterium]|jgi:hypothetical protein|nr:DUF2617 family protein [Phycisphaerales bacterium]